MITLSPPQQPASITAGFAEPAQQTWNRRRTLLSLVAAGAATVGLPGCGGGSATEVSSTATSSAIGQGSGAFSLGSLSSAGMGMASGTQSNKPSPTSDQAVQVQLQGSVTAVASPNHFSINGITVMTQADTVFAAGADSIAVGARVQARGHVMDGAFTATYISLDNSGSSQALDAALKAVGANFVVTSIHKMDADTVEFQGSTVTDLSLAGAKASTYARGNHIISYSKAKRGSLPAQLAVRVHADGARVITLT